MGWIELPPYFSAALETARDVSELYIETPLGVGPTNAMVQHSQGSGPYNALPATSARDLDPFSYLLEVYMDDFMGLAIPTSCKVLDHVANGVICGIHDMFPPKEDEADDPFSLKKLLQRDGAWDTIKELLGFVFNRTDHTMWLSEGKRDALVNIITVWLCSS
jgi:hypothetical protein